MQITLQVKLTPTEEQFNALSETLTTCNAACNHISQLAFSTNVFKQYDLHHACYEAVREHFGLASQLVVRCISKVTDAYKKDRKVQRTFKPTGAIAYDSRILTWNVEQQVVSINTVGGRLKIPFLIAAEHKGLLNGKRREADLVFRNGSFYLLVTVDVETAPEIETDSFLGVDFGIVNIATDSEGNVYSGEQLRKTRRKYQRLRKLLQSKGTKSAKRHLKKVGKKEKRFAKDVNHCISKKIVATASSLGKALATEDLKGIRQRGNRLNRNTRRELHGWSFHQLGSFLRYKAERAGLPYVQVDPKYTSQTCSKCGHCEKANRPSQEVFCCQRCGFGDLADHNAAVNIGVRAASVNPPIVATA